MTSTPSADRRPTSLARSHHDGDGPFVQMALRLHDLGLCPIPCGKADGKKPLLTNAEWKRRPSRTGIAKLTQRPAFRSANIGILTGLSGVTILDIDDSDHVEALVERFGPSPLVTATPSGGYHVWYRSSGEPCASLRSFGFDADLKGLGGFIVVPPSIRPSGEFAGRRYEIVQGSWESLRSLPTISRAWQEVLRQDSRRGSSDPTGSGAPGNLSAIRQGERNNILFHEALALANTAESPDELQAELRALNEIHCEPPLPTAEVERIARSAWRYRSEGRLFTSREPGFGCSYGLIEQIGEPSAFWLYVHLRRHHATKVPSGESFAISAQAMARANSIPGMGARAIRTARDHLLAVRVLIEVKHGGRGPGDASRYAFAPPEPDRPA